MTWVVLAAAAALAAAPEPVELGRLPRPALAVAFLGENRVLVVDAEKLSSWRLEPSPIALESSVDAPIPADRVRHVTALVHADENERAAWVLASGWAEAVLVGIEDGTLAVRSTAKALPWPRAANGVRFRAGTSLIEGSLTGLAPGPYVALSPDGSAAVDAEGQLVLGSRPESQPRLGSSLVRLGPATLLASSAAAQAPDAILLIAAGAPPERLPVPGLVRALAVRAAPSGHVAVLVVEDAEGHALFHLDLPRPVRNSR